MKRNSITSDALEKARQLMDRSEYEAAAAYDKAFQTTQDLTALSGLASALNECGQYARAMREIKKALKSNPRVSNLHAIKGKINARCGKYKAALLDFGSAARLRMRKSAPTEDSAPLHLLKHNVEQLRALYDKGLLRSRSTGRLIRLASSPWRNHVFLSGEICIGDSGDLDDG